MTQQKQIKLTQNTDLYSIADVAEMRGVELRVITFDLKGPFTLQSKGSPNESMRVEATPTLATDYVNELMQAHWRDVSPATSTSNHPKEAKPTIKRRTDSHVPGDDEISFSVRMVVPAQLGEKDIDVKTIMATASQTSINSILVQDKDAFKAPQVVKDSVKISDYTPAGM